MIKNTIIFRDYETGSTNPEKTQPVQIAAVAIDIATLEVIPDSLFESTMKPIIDDAEAEAAGMEPLTDEALKKNNFTREELAEAPETKFVWQQYVDYCKSFNLKGKDGGKWDAPIVAGFNNTRFDDVIDIKMCERYGPKLDDRGSIPFYHPAYNFDAYKQVYTMFFSKNITSNGSYSMDACREYLGYKTENAHKADVDVMQGADMLCRFLRLYKNIVQGKLFIPKGQKIKFKGCVNGAL